MRLLFVFVFLLGLVSCGVKPKYYYGEVQFSSPDGKIFYGSTKSLVKRQILEKEAKIIETVKQDGQIIPTILFRKNNTNEFIASSADEDFTGGIIFEEGEDWKWTKWKYNIFLPKEKLILIGKGELLNNIIKTEKFLIDEKGEKKVKLTEELKELKKKEFTKLWNKQKTKDGE
ncbi:MAG: hypothetical protein P8I93_04280 [Crocinitomicaceae bacterium]|nr:hypothetical protein [Crocinitomicaceae bacterium]